MWPCVYSICTFSDVEYKFQQRFLQDKKKFKKKNKINVAKCFILCTIYLT